MGELFAGQAWRAGERQGANISLVCCKEVGEDAGVGSRRMEAVGAELTRRGPAASQRTSGLREEGDARARSENFSHAKRRSMGLYPEPSGMGTVVYEIWRPSYCRN